MVRIIGSGDVMSITTFTSVAGGDAAQILDIFVTQDFGSDDIAGEASLTKLRQQPPGQKKSEAFRGQCKRGNISKTPSSIRWK